MTTCSTRFSACWTYDFVTSRRWTSSPVAARQGQPSERRGLKERPWRIPHGAFRRLSPYCRGPAGPDAKPRGSGLPPRCRASAAHARRPWVPADHRRHRWPGPRVRCARRFPRWRAPGERDRRWRLRRCSPRPSRGPWRDVIGGFQRGFAQQLRGCSTPRSREGGAAAVDDGDDAQLAAAEASLMASSRARSETGLPSTATRMRSYIRCPSRVSVRPPGVLETSGHCDPRGRRTFAGGQVAGRPSRSAATPGSRPGGGQERANGRRVAIRRCGLRWK